MKSKIMGLLNHINRITNIYRINNFNRITNKLHKAFQMRECLINRESNNIIYSPDMSIKMVKFKIQ